jgi:predicted ester cyclase
MSVIRGNPGTRLNMLARQPLAWTAAAAFVGASLGLAGVLRLAAWFGDDSYGAVGPPPTLAFFAAPLGELLVTLSLLGVPSLLGGASGAAARGARMLGFLLVSLFLVVYMGNLAYQLGWIPLGDGVVTSGRPPLLLLTFWVLGACLPPLAVFPFALAAFLVRRARLGALLLGVCALAVPHLLVWQVISDGYVGAIPRNDAAVSVLLGGPGIGIGLLEAPLWVLLGAALFRGAQRRASTQAQRLRSEVNLEAARRLYEGGLGAGDFSVVDELVSGDFRDTRSGARGRLGMERVFADLWASYPDLSTSIEDQEAEGDLVKTHLALSGTDRGRGVMWYPPTGRGVSFEAGFVDRFEDGLLVEHAGHANTGDLLRQLGHREGTPPSGTSSPAEPGAASAPPV